MDCTCNAYQLENYGCKCGAKKSEEVGRLESPECYLHTETGDLFIIWWAQNRPTQHEWVRISQKAWEVLTGHKLGTSTI